MSSAKAAPAKTSKTAVVVKIARLPQVKSLFKISVVILFTPSKFISSPNQSDIRNRFIHCPSLLTVGRSENVSLFFFERFSRKKKSCAEAASGTGFFLTVQDENSISGRLESASRTRHERVQVKALDLFQKHFINLDLSRVYAGAKKSRRHFSSGVI
jgi:hypothetical protein